MDGWMDRSGDLFVDGKKKGRNEGKMADGWDVM